MASSFDWFAKSQQKEQNWLCLLYSQLLLASNHCCAVLLFCLHPTWMDHLNCMWMRHSSKLTNKTLNVRLQLSPPKKFHFYQLNYSTTEHFFNYYFIQPLSILILLLNQIASKTMFLKCCINKGICTLFSSIYEDLWHQVFTLIFHIVAMLIFNSWMQDEGWRVHTH